MNRKVKVGILFCIVGALAAQAQENKPDSTRLQEYPKGEEELYINPEAIEAIRFDFNVNPDETRKDPFMYEDKPWMNFVTRLPNHFTDTTKQVYSRFVRLLPYSSYNKWNEDPILQMISEWERDSLKHFRLHWKLNNLAPDLSRMNGHVPVPAGMDPTITPSASPLIGGLDTDKFLYETFTKQGRTLRYNRRHAQAWKTYKDYIPTKEDTVRKDTTLMLDLLRRQAEELYPTPHEREPLVIPTDTLFFKNESNDKYRKEKIPQPVLPQLRLESPKEK